MTILVLTVGGSCEPIVTSIRQNKPDRIHFLCSADSRRMVDGQGKVCGKDPNNRDKVNILTQANVSVEYTIHLIDNFDDLNTCYVEALQILRKARDQHPDARIVADYTGGTKSMSAGLAAAAMDVATIEVCLVKGERTDLVKVLDGTQSIRMAGVHTPILERFRLIADRFFRSYSYASASEVLEQALSLPIATNDEQLQHWLTAARAFDAWDKFDHPKALELLQAVGGDYHSYLRPLLQIIESQKQLVNDNRTTAPLPNTPRYEVVFDLLKNAERRATQHRYDDAVARLYRALEVLAQLVLRIQCDIHTGSVDIERMPEVHRQKYEKLRNERGRIQLPLVSAYELLADLGNQVGRAFFDEKGRILGALEARNYSILAHGFIPVKEEEYRKVKEVFDGFFRKVWELLKVSDNVPQLPNNVNGRV